MPEAADPQHPGGLNNAPRASDPYRWLERDAPETRAWLEAQQRRAAGYLAEIQNRETLHRRLLALTPPAELVEEAGELPPAQDYIQSNALAWTLDGAGIYYDRFFPWPGFHALCYHRVGTPSADDQFIYHRPDCPAWHYLPHISADGRYLVVTILQGSDIRNRLAVLDLACPGEPLLELIPNFEARYDYVGNAGPLFWLRVESDAYPNGCVVAVNLECPDRAAWQTVIPETAQPLQAAQYLPHCFVAVYLENACSHIKLFTLEGALMQAVALPGCGTVADIHRLADGRLAYTYQDFITPPTPYLCDPPTTDSPLPIGKGGQGEWEKETLSNYETRQVWYPSRDGVLISMFLSHKRGLELNDANPTYLHVYGGFNTALTPQYSADALAWMEMGGVYAVANLRGGSEYGYRWHQAALGRNKQKTFDDCLAAAEWLAANHYTCPARLALGGESNGGLTAAACLTQRPDLFGAVVIEAGLMDMLRFDQLGMGQDWVCEYGSPHHPPDLEALAAYSPLHHVKPGTVYPPTLILTSASDKRVGAAHSFKFAAALQAAQAGPAPIILRLTEGKEHGEDLSADQRMTIATDRLAFLAWIFQIKTS